LLLKKYRKNDSENMASPIAKSGLGVDLCDSPPKKIKKIFLTAPLDSGFRRHLWHTVPKLLNRSASSGFKDQKSSGESGKRSTSDQAGWSRYLRREEISAKG
jgi:hypothetical protein